MAAPGLTLDTGALIALERRDRRMLAVLTAAQQDDLTVTVPAPVFVEWFRGKPKRVNAVVDAVTIEPLTAWLARIAGDALVGLPECVSVVDAVVMASAAQRGDYVYTSDIPDLQSLQGVFPAVRLFKV
jgi:predicted nucleic acid-binding protein